MLKFDINPNTKQCENILFYPIKSNNNDNNKSGKEYMYEYVIDNDFFIEPNLLYNLRYNKQHWNIIDPNIFDVNRWIKHEKGKKSFLNYDQFIPFSIGKRNCVGMSLAIKEISLILANLILKYKFDTKTKHDIQFAFGMNRSVYPQHPLIVSRR